MITPKNEQGVVVLFQELSKKLGLKLVSVQVPFPDAIVEDTNGNTYRVEFEYRAFNFLSPNTTQEGAT